MQNTIKTLFYSIILTAAASQLYAERQLLVPFDLATDKDGYVYVADQRGGSGAIYKYDSNGTRLSELTAGSSNNGIGAIAVDKRNGVVYFTTPNSSPHLWKLDPNGKLESFGPSSLDPTSLVVDNDGDLYICESRYLTKFNKEGVQVNIVARLDGDGNKVFCVDKENRVYYTNGADRPLMRATPTGESYDFYKFDTRADAMAIVDEADAPTLYIADKQKRTIRKHYPDNSERDLIGHYGDIRALALVGKNLYIANGCDGVLKVDADSGKCAGTRLFQLQKPYDYFAKITKSADGLPMDGPYYMSYTRNVDKFKSEASVDLYNSDGTPSKLGVATGTRAKGLALDKDNALAFTMREKSLDSYLCWRPANYEEFQALCLEPEGVAYFNYVGLGYTKERFFVAEKDSGTVEAFRVVEPYRSISKNLVRFCPVVSGVKGLRGLAANDNGYVYWVSTQDKVIGRAKSVRGGDANVWDIYDDNKTFITDLDEPEAVATDSYNWVYVTNTPESEEGRHIYSPDGKLLSELYADGMKNLYGYRMYLRGLFTDGDGRDITVLQRFGDSCEVWKYSNVFAN